MRVLALLLFFALAADADSILFVDDSGFVTVVDSNPGRLQVVEQDYGGLQNFVITILPPFGATESIGTEAYYEIYIGSDAGVPSGCVGQQCFPLLAAFTYDSSRGIIGDPQPSVGDLNTYPADASCGALGPYYCSLFPAEGVPQLLAFTDWNSGVRDTVSIVLTPEPATVWITAFALLVLMIGGRGMRRELGHPEQPHLRNLSFGRRAFLFYADFAKPSDVFEPLDHFRPKRCHFLSNRAAVSNGRPEYVHFRKALTSAEVSVRACRSDQVWRPPARSQ